MSPLLADFVAKVCDYFSEAAAFISKKGFSPSALFRAVTPHHGAPTLGVGYARHPSIAGGGRATNFASRRRF
jgi:hypothetical protein